MWHEVVEGAVFNDATDRSPSLHPHEISPCIELIDSSNCTAYDDRKPRCSDVKTRHEGLEDQLEFNLYYSAILRIPRYADAEGYHLKHNTARNSLRSSCPIAQAPSFHSCHNALDKSRPIPSPTN